MSGASRPVVATKRNPMRPPIARPLINRAFSATPTLTGRQSPADSLSSSRQRSPANAAGNKRKEREFEYDAGEETSINVVVRCRGRSDREVKENSGVVVSANGVKGTAVELSMGANAVSNKTYHFDRVFSPAADQAMIYDEVVAPILSEVISGFNCTIFAYGQTGTGKTYTMSGDISNLRPLPDESGIIPRVLDSLFTRLENEDTESSVKCSFIELYNEELRDLISADETAKLKIFDDSTRKSHGATLVQGMEETYIKTASKGIDLLRIGSHKRQVAATKCNDLSSRGHTVFTITVYIKRTSEDGEDYVTSGKLNLVDLAGSENIQRSGAENKRATEAGLINKSLLTLGRVINALVDKGTHIPYRESKLTRLLQDSLGGRTKTCIIATLSPAKSNLEETISTLDYAFRAKNIRNKPQMNSLVSKKTLIREFTAEIEKLKSELIATRHRNGVYLSTENYEEITTESESRRILSEEQKDKIETMESNLRSKAQELFNLTSNLTSVKKDNESVKIALEDTKSALGQTEIVLSHTRQTLAEETMLRQAHQATEEELARTGEDMISTLGRTTADINGLHSKLRRRSDLQSLNRGNWESSQNLVAETTESIAQRLLQFEGEHQTMTDALNQRMKLFVENQLARLEESRVFLAEKSKSFDESEDEVNEQNTKAQEEMNKVLDEIKSLREDVKQKVGEGLGSLSAAAQQISAGVISELESFHTQLHKSYTALGKDFKSSFDDLSKRLASQESECNDLRQQIANAGHALTKANENASIKLQSVFEEEKVEATEERAQLIAQMSSMLNQLGQSQEKRMEGRLAVVRSEIDQSNSTYAEHHHAYDESMNMWALENQKIQDDLAKSRESVKLKIKKDWSSANDQNNAIQSTTQSVHQETIRIVDAQMGQMDSQLKSLDEILDRVKSQNSQHHNAHVESLKSLGSTVKQSYQSIEKHLVDSSSSTEALSSEFDEDTRSLTATLDPMLRDIDEPLSSLRRDVLAQPLVEYMPTGQTPQKTNYQYPSALPRTGSHVKLIERFRNPNAGQSPNKPTKALALEDIDELVKTSPTKGRIFTDDNTVTGIISFPPPSTDDDTVTRPKRRPASRPKTASGLRELDINVNEGVKVTASKESNNFKRPRSAQADFSASVGAGAKPPRKAAMAPLAEGPENNPFSASVNGGIVKGGKHLRGNRGS